MNIPEQQIKEKCIGKIRTSLKSGTWNVFATKQKLLYVEIVGEVGLCHLKHLINMSKRIRLGGIQRNE